VAAATVQDGVDADELGDAGAMALILAVLDGGKIYA